MAGATSAHPHRAATAVTVPPAGIRGTLARFRESFAHTPRTLALVWRSSRRATVGLGVLTGLAVVLPLLVAYVGKGIVDAVVAPVDGAATCAGCFSSSRWSRRRRWSSAVWSWSAPPWARGSASTSTCSSWRRR